jgi:hypothetical protein
MRCQSTEELGRFRGLFNQMHEAPAPEWHWGFDVSERETGLEPATFSLEG